ncbi:hypothetical protein ACLOJK_002413 [Asimina triloba]
MLIRPSPASPKIQIGKSPIVHSSTWRTVARAADGILLPRLWWQLTTVAVDDEQPLLQAESGGLRADRGGQQAERRWCRADLGGGIGQPWLPRKPIPVEASGDEHDRSRSDQQLLPTAKIKNSAPNGHDPSHDPASSIEAPKNTQIKGVFSHSKEQRGSLGREAFGHGKLGGSSGPTG